MPTVRQQIIALLQEQALDARELSQALSIMEKEVYGHLEHIDRTICRQGMKLVVQPFYEPITVKLFFSRAARHY